MGRTMRWSPLAIVVLVGASLLSALLPPPRADAQQAGPSPAEQAYVEWLLAHANRQAVAAQAVPASLDLANPSWRREQVLALDTWGALIQEARDQRPPSGVQGLHSQLLDALAQLDRARRLLLVAIATGQDPGPELPTQLRLGRQGLDAATERARAFGEGRPSSAAQPSVTRGNLRVTLLGVTRPYLDRGSPWDPAWEYVTVRLRLENTGGPAVRYDAFHFRLRSADDTLRAPVPLGMPEELQYGALEGNRLAAQVVGNIAYAVRKGVPSVALFYEPAAGEAASQIPLSDLGQSLVPSPTAAP
jgi:hypothetical protein